jgi:hypothetical protein
MKCVYCEQPFDPGDRWHIQNGLNKHCSHGCRYSCELPLSHSGQTFVSSDAMGELREPDDDSDSILETTDAGASVGLEELNGNDYESAVSFIRLISVLPTIDRTLIVFKIKNPRRSLESFAKDIPKVIKNDYDKYSKISIQAVHHRLIQLHQKHPILRSIISIRGLKESELRS